MEALIFIALIFGLVIGFIVGRASKPEKGTMHGDSGVVKDETGIEEQTL